jgi:hypothetical protein
MRVEGGEESLQELFGEIKPFESLTLVDPEFEFSEEEFRLMFRGLLKGNGDTGVLFADKKCYLLNSAFQPNSVLVSLVFLLEHQLKVAFLNRPSF